MMGTQLQCQTFFVISARYGHDVKTGFLRVLKSQMSQSANTGNCDNIARSGLAVPQRAENGFSGAKKRRSLLGRNVIGNRDQGILIGDHIFRIAAICGQRRCFAMPPVPPNAHTLAFFPSERLWPQPVHNADHLMAGNAWICACGPFNDLRISVANATGFNPEQDLFIPWLGNGNRHQRH